MEIQHWKKNYTSHALRKMTHCQDFFKVW